MENWIYIDYKLLICVSNRESCYYLTIYINLLKMVHWNCPYWNKCFSFKMRSCFYGWNSMLIKSTQKSSIYYEGFLSKTSYVISLNFMTIVGVSYKSKKCMSVGNFWKLSICLSVIVVVVCLCPRSCLCRGLEYLPKVKYIILVDSNGALFSISNSVFFCYGMETLPYVWKINPKNERHLRLVAHIITKLSQNGYPVNTHILM